MNKKSSAIDIPETYEKSPYFVRIANPANLNALFDEVRNEWLESGSKFNNMLIHNQIFLSTCPTKDTIYSAQSS